TNVEGTLEKPNDKSGVVIMAGALENRVGTNSIALEANTISGNKWNGVVIAGQGTNANIVAGNRIGTQIDGKSPLPNGKEGVRIQGNASNNRIGSIGDGIRDDKDGNIIAF